MAAPVGMGGVVGVKRHGTRPRSPMFWLAAALMWPSMMVLTKRDWHGTENLQRTYPPDDGIVVAANHLSWFDPMSLCHVLYDNGRTPRILIKDALFQAPVVGTIISGAGQIPVARETEDAQVAVAEAVAAIHDGEAVLVYPEGTLTRDADLWPMSGRTGAARIALMSGAPVIPIAQWGPQEVMGPYEKALRLFPRKTMHAQVGAPVDLEDLRGLPITAEVLAEATGRIIADITSLLAELRGEEPPNEPLDYKSLRTKHIEEDA